MSNDGHTTARDVEQTSGQVYDAVVDERSWWFGDFTGSTIITSRDHKLA